MLVKEAFLVYECPHCQQENKSTTRDMYFEADMQHSTDGYDGYSFKKVTMSCDHCGGRVVIYEENDE